MKYKNKTNVLVRSERDINLSMCKFKMSKNKRNKTKAVVFFFELYRRMRIYSIGGIKKNAMECGDLRLK